MSNFSSLKNVPPVFQGLTTDKVLKKLREPFSIAILASLGVHGLLWFGLPLLSSSATKAPEQRALNVIELSPLEQQARLPQSSSLLQPSPNPNQSKSQKSDSSTAGIPMVPLDAPIPDPNPFYQIPTDSTSQSFTDFSATTKRSASKPKPKMQKEETQKETETTESRKEETSSDKQATNSDNSSTSSEDLIGSDGKPLSKGRDEQEKLALQQSFAFNAGGTSQQDINSKLGEAANQISEKFNIENWVEKPIAINVPYPKEACQFQHDSKPVQGTTGLVVVMMPDGTRGDTALMVKSSGFKGLDDAAVKFVDKQWNDVVKQSKVEPGSKPKAFVLEMTTAPTTEDCAGAKKPVS